MLKLRFFLIIALIICNSICSFSADEDDDSEEEDNPDKILLPLDFETKSNLAAILSRD